MAAASSIRFSIPLDAYPFLSLSRPSRLGRNVFEGLVALSLDRFHLPLSNQSARGVSRC